MRKVLGLLFITVVCGAAALNWFQPYLFKSAQERADTVLRNIAPDVFGPARKTPSEDLRKALASKGLSLGMPVFIRIMKESSELEVWMQREDEWVLAESKAICRWSGALGPKMREGDGQSPEGFYAVTRNALNPNSTYHLSFNLGFPNAFDVAQGRTGSFLMVHGDCVSIGCYAMTNAGITDIYAMVEAALNNGQASVPVHVFPFRMTDENMARHAASPHLDFWRNLKRGWDLYEVEKRPPLVSACDGSYRFNHTNSASDCKEIVGL